MIDFHCHLDLYSEPERVVRECGERGVHVLSVTTTPSAWHGSSKLVAGTSRVRLALGLHPLLAKERKAELPLFSQLLPQTHYVGEIGLDGSAEGKSQWGDQVQVFETILLACANAGGRIMSIHSRRAAKEVLKRISASPKSGVAILHWFTGSERELDVAIEIGCWFSVGPAMLSSEKGRRLAARMPRDRVLTESDGPFAQFDRGPCMPWDVAKAEATLADIWQLDLQSTKDTLRSNLRRVAEHAREVPKK